MLFRMGVASRLWEASMTTGERIIQKIADGFAQGATGREIGEAVGMTTAQANKACRRLAAEGLIVESNWLRNNGDGTEWTRRDQVSRVPAASIVWLSPEAAWEYPEGDRR